MMRRLAPLALLLATCAPAVAQSGSLVAEAGLARYALAADDRLFLDRLDQASRAVFEQALGADVGVPGDVWSQVMTGALQLWREDETNGETLWFNPLFDAGLATQWKRGPNGWRAVAAIPVTGEMLRGEAFSANPVTWSGKGNLHTILQDKARVTWRASEYGDWFAASRDGAGTAVVDRALAAAVALNVMRTSVGYDEAILSAWRALTKEDESKLPEDVRQGLYATGPRARESLRPVAAFSRPGGWAVAMQSPDAPRLTWLALFANPTVPGQAAEFSGYALVDLGGEQ